MAALLLVRFTPMSRVWMACKGSIACPRSMGLTATEAELRGASTQEVLAD